MNNKATHAEALFGYSYSVAMPHFIRNEVLSVDCTLSNCYQLVLSRIYHKTDLPCTVTYSCIKGANRFQQTL